MSSAEANDDALRVVPMIRDRKLRHAVARQKHRHRIVSADLPAPPPDLPYDLRTWLAFNEEWNRTVKPDQRPRRISKSNNKPVIPWMFMPHLPADCTEKERDAYSAEVRRRVIDNVRAERLGLEAQFESDLEATFCQQSQGEAGS